MIEQPSLSLLKRNHPMQTNNHQITNYDVVLDQKFGKEGTPERAKAEEDAQSIYLE